LKVYISGKITGERDYRKKFFEVERQLREMGHVPISPAIQPDGLTPADYIRVDLAFIDAAEVVLFLPDYTESRGATLEWHYCQYVGKQCAYDIAQLGGGQI
jgi:hypothetical protein